MTTNNRKNLFLLFFNMLYISTFTFGGGFVIVTFMKKIFVDKYHWITEDEMLDITALSQASPGAIAVNAAILVGFKVAGFAGFIVAVLGTIIPPMVILSVISLFYDIFKANQIVALMLAGMRAGVAAIIIDVSFDLFGNVKKSNSLLSYVIMIVAFICSFVMGINVMYIILGCILTGIIATFIKSRKKEAVR